MLVIKPVAIMCTVNRNQMGWISKERASSEDGLLENHDYVDMRNVTREEALQVLLEEESAMSRLAAADYDDTIITEIVEEFSEIGSPCSGFDLGVIAAVHSLSAIGCVPISSCNGGCFGGFHPLPQPWIIFYARRRMLSALIAAATKAHVGLVNNVNGMLELYADDARKFPRFAHAVLELS